MEEIISTEYLALAKESLSIVETSKLKDKEILMLIESAISDLDRVGVDVKNNTDDSLIKNTIMIYVKGHFGDTDVNKKQNYIRLYKQKLRELQFTEKYQKKEDESNV